MALRPPNENEKAQKQQPQINTQPKSEKPLGEYIKELHVVSTQTYQGRTDKPRVFKTEKEVYDFFSIIAPTVMDAMKLNLIVKYIGHNDEEICTCSLSLLYSQFK